MSEVRRTEIFETFSPGSMGQCLGRGDDRAEADEQVQLQRNLDFFMEELDMEDEFMQQLSAEVTAMYLFGLIQGVNGIKKCNCSKGVKIYR